MSLSLSSLLKPMARIAVFNGLGMGLYILFMMFLTRSVNPTEMGVYGHFMMLVSFGSLFSTLGFESTIVGCKTRKNALLTTGGVIYLSLLSSVCIVCVIGFLQSLHLIPQYFSALALAAGAVSIFFSNMYSAFQFLKTRDCDYNTLARGGFFNGAFRGVFQSAFTFVASTGSYAMMLGDALARVCSSISLSNVQEIKTALKLPVHSFMRLVKNFRSKFAHFFQYFSANILEALLFWMPVLLFGQLYGMETSGYIALVSRIFSGPVSLVSRAVADVYHGQAQLYANNLKGLRAITFKIWGGVGFLALMIPVGIAVVGSAGFELIFGREWGQAHNVALAMAPLLAIQLIAPVFTRFGLVTNLVTARILYILACLGTAGLFYLFGAGLFQDMFTGILVYALINMVFCLIYVGFLARRLFLEPARLLAS